MPFDKSWFDVLEVQGCCGYGKYDQLGLWQRRFIASENACDEHSCRLAGFDGSSYGNVEKLPADQPHTGLAHALAQSRYMSHQCHDQAKAMAQICRSLRCS